MNIDKGLIKHWKMLFENNEAMQNGEEPSFLKEDDRTCESKEDYTNDKNDMCESNDEKNQVKELQAKLNKLDELAKKAENAGKLPDNLKDKLENLQNQIHNGNLQAESEEDGIGIGGIVTIAGVIALADTLIDVLLGLI